MKRPKSSLGRRELVRIVERSGVEIADSGLPRWANVLQEAVAEAVRGGPFPVPAAEPALDPGDPLPFEELLVPFLRYARRISDRHAGHARLRLTDAARARLERELLEVLAAVSARALYLEFDEHRTARSSTARGEDTGTGVYAGFVRRMLSGELVPFLMRYPVLARLLGTLVGLWVEATVEFLTRLDADWPAIERAFGGGRALGPVADLEPGLSDRHRGGRSTARLSFASGARVVYKPRDLSPEAGFFEFVRWVDDRDGGPELARPVILERSGYGWMEHVPYLPCADRREAGLYHRRAGKLLCLLDVLGATDCHAGNLIARGDHPVPIDLETLLQPRGGGPRGPASGTDVLRVGMLPVWKRRPDGRRYDVAALTGSIGRERSFRAWRGRAINTGAMELDIEYSTVPSGENVLFHDGAPVRAGDHVGDVVAGFAGAWRFLSLRRDDLIAGDGPLARFAALPVRIVVRSTLAYARACHETLHPDLLRDGAERGTEIDRLCRDEPCLTVALAPRDRLAMVRSEREAIDRMDIPLFHTRADRAVIQSASGESIGTLTARPGFTVAVDRVLSLDETGLEEAVGLIRTTLGLSRVAALL